MDLDDLDSEDSTYLQIDRYKNKCMQIFKKLAELKSGGAPCNTGRRRDKPFRYEKIF
jgi:hypothetical protein